MLIGKRCTVCHRDVGEDPLVTCDACGNALHKQCAEFETTFECPECAEDPEIGAFEF